MRNEWSRKEAVCRSGVHRHLVMFMCSKHAAQKKLSRQMAAGKQLDRVKRRVLQAALQEQSREVQGLQGQQATHCREAHAL